MAVQLVAVALAATVSLATGANTGVVIWTKCDASASLAAASSWVANASSQQLSLIATDAGDVGGLCLTHPGKEVPAAWGPHLVAQPCDASAATQRWAVKDQMLQYMGEPSAAAVCIQADAASPWVNAPAATWPCPAKPAWNTAIAQLKGSGAPGAVKLQLNMKVDKLCLSYAAAPPAPPPAKLAKPTPQQLEWQDYEMGALHTVTPLPLISPARHLKPNPLLLLLLLLPLLRLVRRPALPAFGRGLTMQAHSSSSTSGNTESSPTHMPVSSQLHTSNLLLLVMSESICQPIHCVSLNVLC